MKKKILSFAVLLILLLNVDVFAGRQLVEIHRNGEPWYVDCWSGGGPCLDDVIIQ